MWFFNKKARGKQDRTHRQTNVSWTCHGVSRTHTGSVRDQNEDALMLYTSQEEDGMSTTLALIADGMGGHAAGEVASQICIDTFVSIVRDRAHQDPVALLAMAMHLANGSIYQHAARDTALKGMGTTCSALLLRNGQAWIANVGDSRVYLHDGNTMQQLTVDDTLVNEWVKAGKITQTEAEKHPDANILVQALGTKPEVRCTPLAVEQLLKPGMRLLLCSDGLYDMVDTTTIANLLMQGTPGTSADRLIESALQGGGRDNISVIVIELTPVTPESTSQALTGNYQMPSSRE
jgi:protein phosphatase